MISLTLDLLPSPSSGLNCTRLKFSVLSGFPNQLGNPGGMIEIGILPVRERVCEITAAQLALVSPAQDEQYTYPMTPMVDLRSDSLRLWS